MERVVKPSAKFGVSLVFKKTHKETFISLSDSFEFDRFFSYQSFVFQNISLFLVLVCVAIPFKNRQIRIGAPQTSKTTENNQKIIWQLLRKLLYLHPLRHIAKQQQAARSRTFIENIEIDSVKLKNKAVGILRDIHEFNQSS